MCRGRAGGWCEGSSRRLVPERAGPPQVMVGAAPTDIRACPDPERDVRDLDAGKRHSGETCLGWDRPCLWLRPGALCGQSSHLTGHQCRLPQHPASHRPGMGAPLPSKMPAQARRGMRVSPHHPVHSWSRSMWLLPAAREDAQATPQAAAQLRHNPKPGTRTLCRPSPNLQPPGPSALDPRAAGSPVTGGRGRSLGHWDSASTCPSTFSARKQAAFFPAKSQLCLKHLSETPHPWKEGTAAILRQPQPPTTSPDADLLCSFMRYVPCRRVPRGRCSAAGEDDGMQSDRHRWPAPSLPARRPLLALSPRVSTALLTSLGCRTGCAGVLPGSGEVLRCHTDR